MGLGGSREILQFTQFPDEDCNQIDKLYVLRQL